MILSCNNISKSFGEDVILDNISFNIEDNEKAALLGSNGAGKSTLLKIIVGQLSKDSGVISLSKGKTLGYLAQHQDINLDSTIYDEILSTKQDIIDMEKRLISMEKEMSQLEGEELSNLLHQYTKLNETFHNINGYSYKSEVVGILKGLGFNEDDFSRKISSLSGGQKTRVALSKLLIQKPNLLILDEPTNHLDLNSISYLENFLNNYNGAVLIVSHDRYFLDKIVTKVIDIDNHKARTYLGNYSAFSIKKAAIRDALYKAYINQCAEIKHQKEVIEKLRSFNREKSIKRANSRQKLLDKITPIDAPIEESETMRLSLKPRIESGKDVLEVNNLSMAFEDNKLFSDVSFFIKKGEKVALIGDNGTGKTTMLKILNNILPPKSGSFSLGSNVEIGYFDQEHHNLSMDKTIFDELSDSYPTLTETEIRNMLASFSFTGDDVFKEIKSLSGGERGRLSLAKLMLSNANFLILDEPTNHLDIDSKEILEDAINSYTGTVLYVSHDRYFINQTAERILDLTNNTIIDFYGDYDNYMEKREHLIEIYAPKEEIITEKIETVTENKLSWEEQKEQKQKEKRLLAQKNKLEKEIEKIENEIEEINRELALPETGFNASRCVELGKKHEELDNKLNNLYEEYYMLED